MIGKLGGLGNLLKNAKKIQEMMSQAQSDMEKIEVSGESGAGLVQINMNARHDIKTLKIDDELLKESKEVLEELIIAAFNDASQKVNKITQDKMAAASNMFGGATEEDKE
jgi:DNA-binding YbaB/EbfC family protein